MYTCPICGYNKLREPAWSSGVSTFEICKICGFEYGYSNFNKPDAIELFRKEWEKSNKYTDQYLKNLVIFPEEKFIHYYGIPTPNGRLFLVNNFSFVEANSNFEFQKFSDFVFDFMKHYGIMGNNIRDIFNCDWLDKNEIIIIEIPNEINIESISLLIFINQIVNLHNNRKNKYKLHIYLAIKELHIEEYRVFNDRFNNIMYFY